MVRDLVDEDNATVTDDTVTTAPRALHRERNYEAQLRQGAEQTKVSIIQQIKQFGQDQENPSFEGGFTALIKWYRDYASEYE